VEIRSVEKFMRRIKNYNICCTKLGQGFKEGIIDGNGDATDESVLAIRNPFRPFNIVENKNHGEKKFHQIDYCPFCGEKLSIYVENPPPES
jgi:hypothetical protein